MFFLSFRADLFTQKEDDFNMPPIRHLQEPCQKQEEAVPDGAIQRAVSDNSKLKVLVLKQTASTRKIKLSAWL